jgi:molybdopterin-containing oxidoreductase family iron-sulfur binding subunit
VDKKAREEVLQDLAAIRKLADKVRERSGIPVVESCAKWCQTYSQMAQWSLGEGERFEFMADQKEVAMETTEKAVAGGNGRAPRWGMTIDLKRCVACQSCTIACKVENGTPPGIFWMRVLEKEEGTFPSARKVFLPLRCNHCSDPPCVPVCPTGASYQREKDNLVLIDQNKCIGCRACIVACPYQVRFITEDSKGYYGEGLTPYEAESYQKWQPRTVQKCTFCVDRLEKGLDPACVQTCPTGALTYGDLNDPESEISRLIRQRAHFQPRAECGTDPSLYYLT